MVDSVSLQNASVGSSANVAETSAQRSAAAATAVSPASAGRSVDDVVDLSQAAQLAQDFRASGELSGQKLVDKLAQSLDQGKTITDAFVAQLQSGRTASTSTATSSGDFDTNMRAAISDIMRSGKPANVFDSIVSRLFGRS